MAVGANQTILVCVPSAFAQAPCPAGMALTSVQGYVIDPSQASNIEAQNAPFDYGYAAGLWTFSFSMVVGLFVLSRSAGAILEFIRRG